MPTRETIKVPRITKSDRIIAAGKERLEISLNAELDNRKSALKSTQFVDGNQWDNRDREERDKFRRPVVTNNLIRKIISQLAGEIRQNIPSIKVKPAHNKDVRGARIRQEIIRNIEYNSTANDIYANALEQALQGGYGYFRIVTEFSNNDTFDQDIRLKKVPNRNSVYFDQRAETYSYEDARYAFVSEWISKEEFKRKYPRKIPEDIDSATYGESDTIWFEPDRLRIAEYFWKEQVTREIAELNTGQVIELDGKKLRSKVEVVIDEKTVITLDAGQPTSKLKDIGLEIIRTRKVKKDIVKWAKISATQILEGPIEFPSRYIPIIPVLGYEVNVEGRRLFRGVSYDGEDSQKVYNYFLSSVTEKVGMLPKAPYVAAYDQIANYEDMWKNSNRENNAVLYYDPVPGLQPPTRQQREDIPAGSMSIMSLMKQDIKDTTGRHDAALGNPSNERSGVAIRERKLSSDTITFTFLDNLLKSITHAGKVLLSMIPTIYDARRTIKIIGDDGVEDWLTVNQEQVDPTGGHKIVIDDLSVGEYDIFIETGAMYLTKRQEAVAGLERLIQFVPAITPAVIDILADLSDWPKKEEITQRITQHFQSLESQAGQNTGQPPQE